MRRLLVALALAAVTAVCVYPSVSAAKEAWPGVDETVVGRYAGQHGRPARANLIDLKGDALLFAFLLAGIAGGFTMGYFYRDFAKKQGQGEDTDAA